MAENCPRSRSLRRSFCSLVLFKLSSQSLLTLVINLQTFHAHSQIPSLFLHSHLARAVNPCLHAWPFHLCTRKVKLSQVNAPSSIRFRHTLEHPLNSLPLQTHVQRINMYKLIQILLHAKICPPFLHCTGPLFHFTSKRFAFINWREGLGAIFRHLDESVGSGSTVTCFSALGVEERVGAYLV